MSNSWKRIRKCQIRFYVKWNLIISNEEKHKMYESVIGEWGEMKKVFQQNYLEIFTEINRIEDVCLPCRFLLGQMIESLMTTKEQKKNTHTIDSNTIWMSFRTKSTWIEWFGSLNKNYTRIHSKQRCVNVSIPIGNHIHIQITQINQSKPSNPNHMTNILQCRQQHTKYYMSSTAEQ